MTRLEIRDSININNALDNAFAIANDKFWSVKAWVLASHQRWSKESLSIDDDPSEDMVLYLTDNEDGSFSVMYVNHVIGFFEPVELTSFEITSANQIKSIIDVIKTVYCSQSIKALNID